MRLSWIYNFIYPSRVPFGKLSFVFLSTLFKFHNGKAMYSNNVRAYNSSISGEVTRLSHFKLNVACLMEQESLSQIMYVVKSDYNNSLIGSGRFNTTMRFYDSNNFYYPVSLAESVQFKHSDAVRC